MVEFLVSDTTNSSDLSVVSHSFSLSSDCLLPSDPMRVTSGSPGSLRLRNLKQTKAATIIKRIIRKTNLWEAQLEGLPEGKNKQLTSVIAPLSPRQNLYLYGTLRKNYNSG